jgi:ABC-2 type transport system permease protein
MGSKGVTAPYQIVAEYIPFLTINVLCTAVTLWVIFTVMHYGIFTMEEFEGSYISDYVSFGIGLIPVCIMFSALGFMIFEILIGVINKILVAFMLYIGMGYVSGYFYPKTFFPGVVQRIGECIPSGVAFRYIGQILTKGHVGVLTLIMLAYTVVFLAIATLLRQQKIR